MISDRRKRSSIALAGAAIAAATYAFVAGCGMGETPPATPAGEGQVAQAEGADGGPGMHHHHMPPPAAFEACTGKAVGDACTADLHDHEINGKCEPAPPGATQTGPACRPEGGPHPKGHHGPPPEIVFAACDGKTAGDACSVAFEKGTVAGACMMPRHDAGAERLLCAPAHPHGHGMGADGGAT